MAIMVECASCRRVTHFADNDAGLAMSCLGCGQRARVPDNRPKPTPPPHPALPRLTRVKASPGRPMVYAAGLVLVLGTAGALGYLKYRAVVTNRNYAAPVAIAAITPKPVVAPSTSQPITTSPPPTIAADSARTSQAIPARRADGPARAVGFVGLDRLELNGRYVVDSYNALARPYRAGAARPMAPLLSNLKVRLYGQAQIAGVVRVGKSGDIKRDPTVTVTPPPAADAADLAPQPLPTPPVDAAAAKNTNDNHRLPEKYYQGKSLFVHARKTVAVPSGVYRLKDMVIEPSATLVLDGPVTFLVSGRLIIYGSVETHDRLPSNLRVWADGGDDPVAIDTAELYVDLYAPRRTIEIHGNGDLYGSVVGKVLRTHGERGLHFDESIPPVLQPIAPSPASDR